MGSPWEVLADDLTAVAPFTGPFPHRPFLEAVERTVPTLDADLVPVRTDRIGAMLVVDDAGVRFAGAEDLTDYHSTLGDDPDGLATALKGLSGHRFRFDSMPLEARVVVTSALEAAGATYTIDEHEAAAVLDLPGSFEEWLASLGKKERHEVRRKRRRFVEQFGDVEVVQAGPEAIDAFGEMHRTSGGEKGSFMTPLMQAYFLDLLTTAGATIHHLVCDGRIRASAFGFETSDAYYYYNSAYDPDAAMASPGVVLFSTLIELQIRRGAVMFDFLKGDEPYKYRHGARRRMLYVAEGALP